MIWGVVPTQHPFSWEGHLAGILVGILLAYVYRKKGPQRPKFQYEIEREQGIDPPDLEGEYWQKVREEEARLESIEEEKGKDLSVTYEYIPREEKKGK